MSVSYVVKIGDGKYIQANDQLDRLSETEEQREAQRFDLIEARSIASRVRRESKLPAFVVRIGRPMTEAEIRNDEARKVSDRYCKSIGVYLQAKLTEVHADAVANRTRVEIPLSRMRFAIQEVTGVRS